MKKQQQKFFYFLMNIWAWEVLIKKIKIFML